MAACRGLTAPALYPLPWKSTAPCGTAIDSGAPRLAKLRRQVARQRSDDDRKWAKAVVTDFDQIAVEDFHPRFLARSTMLMKATNAAIGATKADLLHMANKHGRDLRLVHAAYTTMDCSKCGARAKHRLDPSERTYAREACGAVKPRDKNSAAVMVVGAGFVPAGAEGVRPEPQPAVLLPEQGIPGFDRVRRAV